MNKYSKFTLALLFFVSYQAVAQNQSFFKPSQVTVMPLSSGGIKQVLTNDHIESLTNGEHGLSNDIMEGLSNSNNYFYTFFGPTGIGLNVNLGLQFKNKETGSYRENMLLRLGLQAQTIQVSSNSAFLERRYRIDTMYSNSSGAAMFIDSLSASSASITKRADLLSLDAALIFQTDRSKQWSIFGGVGVNIGASINAFTEVNKQDYSHYDYSGQYVQNNISSFNLFGWTNNYHRFRNRVNVSGLLYLPMGVDMRLGNHSEFWKRLHLFYEVRPELVFHYSPDTGGISAFKFSNGVGITVRL